MNPQSNACFSCFTGGPVETNAHLFESPGGTILFDAPEGADEAFAGKQIGLLFLTHGHFDHVADAAAIRRRHGCPVAAHALTLPMVSDPDFFRAWGFPIDIEPVDVTQILDEGPADLLGEGCLLHHVPGHCPGSLCVFFPQHGVLVGGDVLFAGGIGRWDLPGGDKEALLENLRSKILPLPDAVTVLPGHGPATTIGRERTANPFLA